MKITWGVLDENPIIVNWSGLDSLEHAENTPTSAYTDNWIILTHPLGPEKTITLPILAGAKRILYTTEKASRHKGWWRTGTNKFAFYGLDTEVWISQGSIISRAKMFALKELLQTESEKDLPA